MLFDTHCHLNMIIKKEFDIPLSNNFTELARKIINDAKKVDVIRLINVGTSLPESLNCITLARTFESCFATIGTHPNDLKSNWQDDIKKYKDLLTDKKNKIVGIGEIGLDYHYQNYDKQKQYKAFEQQIQLALDHNLPIVIHTRDAKQEVLDILEQFKQNNLRGIIHCFSEDLAFASRALALGFVLGIGGPLTYPKNETLRSIFKTVPLESIVLETDAPFLPPQNIRGQKNSPVSVRTVAYALAELRDVPYQKIAKTTTETARKLFNII